MELYDLRRRPSAQYGQLYYVLDALSSVKERLSTSFGITQAEIFGGEPHLIVAASFECEPGCLLGWSSHTRDTPLSCGPPLSEVELMREHWRLHHDTGK